MSLLLVSRVVRTCTLLTIVAASALTAAKVDSSRPNVVLFLVDDYGYGDIGFEGNEHVVTPNIDRLARESVRLTNFYQSAGACAPTRAALLTGRDFFRVGVWGVHWGRDFIHRNEKTLGNLFQDAGYRTGVFGKWHSGKTGAYWGWSRGFDTSVHTKLYDYWDSMVLTNNRVVEVAGPMTDVVGDRAVAFIKDAGNQPFFCYVPFQAVHEPFNAPGHLFRKYQARGHSDHVARLYGMIEVLDQNVGKVLDTLERNGLADNTIVLFMVDDGSSPGFDLTYQTRRMNEAEREERRGAWGRRLRGTKANHFEGGQISPCYIRWPAGMAGDRDLDVLGGVLDIYPTLAELCYIPLARNQKPLDGRSLAPALRGESDPWPDRIYIDATNLYLIERPAGTDPRVRWMTARYQNFKYLREDRWLIDGTDVVHHRLFDLATDPTESDDIAAEYPAMTAKLRAAVENWYDEILATPGVFQETVFPVGDWSEYATPINLDATVKVLGDVQRDPGPGFYFTGWDAPGDGLAFKIDALEAGEYVVELNYESSSEQFGATFSAGVGENRVTGSTSHPLNLQLGPIHLPEGESTLDIQLESLGKSDTAVDWLRSLAIRRVPQPGDWVPQGVQFHLHSESGQTLTVEPTSASFAFAEGMPPLAFGALEGETVWFTMSADNSDEIDHWRVYRDFDPILTSSGAGTEMGWAFPAGTDVTLNLVAHHLSGSEVNARVWFVVNE